LGLFFVELRSFFEDLRVVYGLVLFRSCFFWGLLCANFSFVDCFFSNFMALLLFQFTAKRNLGKFFCKFAHFGLVFFRFASLLLFLTYLLVFCFV